MLHVFLSSVLFLSGCATTVSVESVDSVLGSLSNPIDRVGFGSCAKQSKDQSFWPLIAAGGASRKHLDAWFWMGDIIYADCPSVTCVRTGYVELDSKGSYQYFRQALGGRVDGVWDDHDYGLNDAGGKLPIKEESQKLLLDFLRVPSDSPRRTRDGAYSSHRLILRNNRTARVILTDTRKHREPGFSPPVGEWRWLPGSSIIAAGLRTLVALFGAGSKGDMLGETQWAWLEGQLSDSTDDVNILVSSVQVTTTNPAFESWGHYPRSLQRLKNLLIRTRPRGLLLFSGDVHFAQMLGNTSCVMETTTSGLTHSVQDSTLEKQVLLSLLDPLLGQRFDSVSVRGKRLFPGRNWATVEFQIKEEKSLTTLVSVMDLQTGTDVMNFERTFEDDERPDYECLKEYPPLVRPMDAQARLIVISGALAFTVMVYAAISVLVRWRHEVRIKKGYKLVELERRRMSAEQMRSHDD